MIHEDGDLARCKIGFANYASRRLCDLQIGNWRELKLGAVFSMPDRSASELVEDRIHILFRNRWIRGEWFSVSVSEAANAIRAEMAGIGLNAESGEMPELPLLRLVGEA